jgi:hypothetical protein
MSDWTTQRMQGDALAALADRAPRPGEPGPSPT